MNRYQLNLTQFFYSISKIYLINQKAIEISISNFFFIQKFNQIIQFLDPDIYKIRIKK